MASSPVKHKINFLDFLLIVLIIATISAGIVSVIRSNPNQISGGDTEIIYVIRCDGINKNVAQNIAQDDNVYANTSNQLLGRVIKVEQVPITALNENNEAVNTDKVTVLLTVSAKAWKNDGIYSIDTFRIAAGLTVEFHSENLSITGTCTSITENNGGNE